MLRLYSLVDHYGEEGFISPNNSVLKVVETGKPVALNELRSLVRESPVILVITEVSCLACMLSLQSWVGAPYENLYSEIQIVRVFVAPSIYHVRNSIPEIENTSLLENPPINLYDEGGHFVENNALVLRPIVLLLKPGLEIAAAGLPSSDPSAADYFVSKIEEIIK